ncbi:hypothetical protein Scep_016596 [Stephania cephalantha]|uniref:Uncharacterized protein n=1 Tax=Stephania cephalantha TaxID=152367 RepID=A0AAP0IP76_9MAGN
MSCDDLKVLTATWERESFLTFCNLLSSFFFLYVLFLNIIYCINRFLGSCAIIIFFRIVVILLGRNGMLWN